MTKPVNQRSREEKLKSLKDLILYPYEDPQVEYKPAGSFSKTNNPDFTFRLIRNMMGFSNGGGGTIVVGMRETRNGPNISHSPDERLTKQVWESFEITKIVQLFNSCISPENRNERLVEFDFVPVAEKKFPVLSINSFVKDPVFCVKDYPQDQQRERILESGAVYIRTNQGEVTKTNLTPTLEDFNRSMCDTPPSGICANYDFRIPIIWSAYFTETYSTAHGNSPSLDSEHNDWNRKPMTIPKDFQGLGFWEVAHWLSHPPSKMWDQKTLLAAMEKAKCHNTGWPIGVVLHSDSRDEARPKFTQDGIEARITSTTMFPSYDEWILKRDGSFYFLRTLEEDTTKGIKKANVLYFDTRIWRIAESLQHCANLYNSLAVEPAEIINFVISHHGLSDRKFAANNPRRMIVPYLCKTQTSKWSGKFSLSELEGGLLNFLFDICKELFVLFDGKEVKLEIVKEIYEQEFKKSRI